jgi:hypothetical protein
MSDAAVHGDARHVKQGKTGAELRIIVESALAELLGEIRAFKDEVYAKHPSLVRSNPLLITERGRPLTYIMLRGCAD